MARLFAFSEEFQSGRRWRLWWYRSALGAPAEAEPLGVTPGAI